MRLIKIVSVFFIFIIWARLSFAEPGIKITQPENNSIVNPGQQITVTVEAVDGFEIRKGIFGYSNFFGEKFNTLPATFTVTIPQDAAGTFPVVVVAEDILRKNAGKDEIILKVEQTSTLQSLDLGDYSHFYFTTDWDGNPNLEDQDYIRIYGVYSDGVTRKIAKEELAFVSSDPSVVSVDSVGVIKPLKLGKAVITVSSAGASAIVSVFVKKPTGIRPSEFIPPTTQISIQPPANQAGWNNSDITITLTAKDNEGGSGIQEVDWRFAGKAKEDYVYGDSAVVAYDAEGVKNFSYWSRDKEGNEDDNKIDIKLDKTTPVITATISPKPNSYSWNNTNATVSFDATDNLSGIKSVSQPVTVTRQRANHPVNGEAIDIADNKSTAAVTISIDKTPPKLSITATPNILWPNNQMVDVTINGRATDNLSGIDSESLTFKVTDEYGSMQPAITAFGSVIKLEASRDTNDQDSRVYTISVTAKDKAGNESQASTTVTVPYHAGKQGKK